MTELGVGTNRYAYANNDPVNKFDPEGNSWISNIIGIALSFIPGLQPAGAALIAAGLSAVETVAAGGDLGDALKSAVITFAVQMAMYQLQEGIFGSSGGNGDVPGGLDSASSESSILGQGSFSEFTKNSPIVRQDFNAFGEQIASNVVQAQSGYLPPIPTPYSEMMQALGVKRREVPASTYTKIRTVHGRLAAASKGQFLPRITGTHLGMTCPPRNPSP